jgi:hypothetical protein
VLERLPGESAVRLDDALLGEVVALIGRLAGAPAGPHRNDMASWVPAVDVATPAFDWLRLEELPVCEDFLDAIE